jgi:hypothetical protein
VTGRHYGAPCSIETFFQITSPYLLLKVLPKTHPEELHGITRTSFVSLDGKTEEYLFNQVCLRLAPWPHPFLIFHLGRTSDRPLQEWNPSGQLNIPSTLPVNQGPAGNKLKFTFEQALQNVTREKKNMLSLF